MDYKSVFTNLCLELQQNRSWIKGLGKNPQKSELIHWPAVPFVRGHRSVFPRTPRNNWRVYTSSNVCHSHEWRVDTASGKTLKKRNACLHAVRQAVEKTIACIHGLRSEGVSFGCGHRPIQKLPYRFCFQNMHGWAVYRLRLVFWWPRHQNVGSNAGRDRGTRTCVLEQGTLLYLASLHPRV